MREILPILQQVYPSVTGYETVVNVVQDNADGHRVKFFTRDDGADDNTKNTIQHDVFVKTVDASKYATSKKSWSDLRRTLMYLRTEVRFYRELVPDLQQRGVALQVPKVFYSDYDLSGLIDEDEKATDQSGRNEPMDWSAASVGKGGSIIMESITEPYYFQDSPISLDQAKETLGAVAALHASAWEDVELLEKAEKWLSRGSYHLKTRNPKELDGMEEAYDNFASNFQNLMDPSLSERCKDIGKRIKNLAEYISDEISPGPTDSYATLSHGDFKSMNCFLPIQKNKDDDNDDNINNGDDGVTTVAAATATTTCPSRGVILVDFASTGVGLGMSDVAMHIHHAIRPNDLDNDGEMMLFEHYLDTLQSMLRESGKDYPRQVAMKHYQLAVADYFRFFLGRFWKSATPESMQKKRDNKNTALINRDTDAALAFLDRAEKYVTQIENDRTSSTN